MQSQPHKHRCNHGRKLHTPSTTRPSARATPIDFDPLTYYPCDEESSNENLLDSS